MVIYLIRSILSLINNYYSSVCLAILFFVTWLTVPAKHAATIILAVSFFMTWLTIPAKYGAAVIFAVSFIVAYFAISFIVACLTMPDRYGASVHKANYFHITKHLYQSICKIIVFVGTCTNQCTKTTVVCCNPIFCCSSSHMDHSMLKWVLYNNTTYIHT